MTTNNLVKRFLRTRLVRLAEETSKKEGGFHYFDETTAGGLQSRILANKAGDGAGVVVYFVGRSWKAAEKRCSRHFRE